MDGVKAVKRHNAQYDLFNRLHSIASDQAFVRKVAEEWFDNRFEVVPNQRCGTWYCPPSTTYAYFKSTDGHTSNWNFNLRRANIPLATHAEEHNGLILVDSTRRGKRMPDALSKTIPIWCAVINRAVGHTRHLDSEGWDELYLPAGVVSPSEREQIIALIPAWTDSLLSSGIALPALQRPLRPFFVHPSTSRPPHIPSEPDYTPIICLSVSRWVGITGQQDDVPTVTRVGERNVGFDYVPGAGDDDELWAKGLKPSMFWAHREKLLALDRDELDDGVNEVTAHAAIETGMSAMSLGSNDPASSKAMTGAPSSSSRLALDLGPPVHPVDSWTHGDYRESITIWVTEVAKSQAYPEIIYTFPATGRPTDIAMAVPSAKTDSWAHKAALVKLIAFLRPHTQDETCLVLRRGTTAHLDLLIDTKEADGDTAARLAGLPTAPDLVSARKTILPVALLLLCSFPQLDPDTSGTAEELSKSSISTVLLSLVALWPDGNPPRAALKRVNEILLTSSKA